MNRVRFTAARKKRLAVILGALIAIVAAYLIVYPQQELYVIDEAKTLEVFTPYGTFRGVAVAPHLILTVAHGADIPGEMTVNHYTVFKVWSDEDSDLTLLKTGETFYQYSELAADYPFHKVQAHDLGPGDSGMAFVNAAGAVCFLLRGYDHTAGRYVYNPVTEGAVDVVRIASN